MLTHRANQALRYAETRTPIDGMLTIQDLATAWHVERSTIERAYLRGGLPVYRVQGTKRGRILIDPAEADAWLRRRLVRSYQKRPSDSTPPNP